MRESLCCSLSSAFTTHTMLARSQGAGNTVFPLLAKNENPQLVVHACDYAASAVEVVKVCDDVHSSPLAMSLMSFYVGPSPFSQTQCIPYLPMEKVSCIPQSGT